MNWQSWIGPFSVLVFLAVAALEMWQPRFPPTQPQVPRWTLHIALWAVIPLLTTFVLRISALGLAESRPGTLSFLPFLLLFDAALWLSHYAMHNYGPLWIWHAIHHSDPDLDASTGFRFHPLEGLWDQAVLLLIIYLAHPTLTAVIGLQFFTIASNYFVHANLALPPRLDQALSWVIMTPGLHRSHHAIELHSQKSNYGITLTLWDRLFQTLHRTPPAPTLGIAGLPTTETLKPLFLLATLPWREWKKL